MNPRPPIHHARTRAPAAAFEARCARGFTLIELMIAISLLMVVGLMLITSLRQTIAITTEGNAEGEVMTRAQAVLSLIERDLKAVHAGDEERFVTGTDPWGRPWVGFVRSMPEERKTYGGYISGAGASGSGTLQEWRGDAPTSTRYAALGGLCEVAYFMEPGENSTRLCRAVLAPLRRETGNGFLGGGLIQGLETWNDPSQQPTQYFPSDVQVVADAVLYFGVSMQGVEIVNAQWTPAQNQPTWQWDSALLVDASSGMGRRGSNAQMRPLGLPAQVRIELTVDRDAPQQFLRELSGAISESEATIPLDDSTGIASPESGNGYVRIGSEWVEYAGVGGDLLLNCRRGARGTRPQSHAPFTQELDPDWDPSSGEEQALVDVPTPVRQGANFIRILHLPCGR